MATYPRITPATLANFSPVINDPTDAEDANKAAQIDLQSRRFVYDYLITKFSASTELLLAAAVGDASVAGKIKGSTANSGGSQQAIVQGTVSTPDLRDDAVATAKIIDTAITTAKVIDAAITAAKLATDSVETAKVKDLNITTAKLAANAVTAAKLSSDAATDANRAVTTDHIRDSAVTAAKIAANVISPADKLSLAGASGKILVSDSNQKYQPVTPSGDATISTSGVITLATQSHTVIEESVGNTVSGGASIAGGAGFTSTTVRGSANAWVKNYETVTNDVTLAASGKIQVTAGTWLIRASAPGYKCGKHMIRIAKYNSSDVFQSAVYGTSESSAAADACTTRSFVEAKFTMTATDYFKIEHWQEVADANGLGLATSAGGSSEKYAVAKLQKVSS